MEETQPTCLVTKLLSRHTEAGIEVSYDDHCVSLRRNGEVLKRENTDGTFRTIAVWTRDVTIAELIAEADHYLPEEVKV